MQLILLLISLVAAASAASAPTLPYTAPLGYKVVESNGLVPIKSHNESTLYSISADDGYATHIYLLDLKSSTHYQQGFDYAVLAGKLAVDAQASFFKHVSPADLLLLHRFLDWLWDDHLELSQRPYFLEEMFGLRDGGRSIGIPDMDKLAQRFVTLGNMPADLPNIEKLVEYETQKHGMPEWMKKLEDGVLDAILKIIEGHKCDCFASWGPRTVDGNVRASRNLDWTKDTGISAAKMVTVYHAVEVNQHTYATVGFAGFSAALAGMSAAGLTVSEDNLDNSLVTFDGMSWPFRLRDVLANAGNLHQAMQIWNRTDNTASNNFLISSANEGSSAAAVALEAIRSRTAVYSDNDPREAAAQYTWPGDSQPSLIGKPIPNAVFRSNHALDATIMQTQVPLWNDTVWRYTHISDRISKLQQTGKAMDDFDGIDIVATLGQKGGDYYSCDQDFSDGSNIMSILFSPHDRVMYVAFEEGTGKTWRPACCNSYVRLNMSAVFE